jgi:hypothetical protein
MFHFLVDFKLFPIPMGFNDWAQMQCVILKAKRWGRLNLVYNAKENLRANKSMG